MFERSMWSYSIRIRLLVPGEEGYQTAEQRGFETAQLRERHWIIRDGTTGQVEHVRGEGVIGKYPLLSEGGYRDDEQGRRGIVTGEHCNDVFVYQSCSGRLGNGEGGSFGGELIFVPGSLDDPKGDGFEV